MWIVYILSAGVSLGFSSAPQAPNAAAQPRLKAGAQRTLEGVGCSRLFGQNYASKTCKTCMPTPGHRFFSPEPVSPACPGYLSGRRDFAAANSPIFCPMAVPTSVEVR